MFGRALGLVSRCASIHTTKSLAKVLTTVRLVNCDPTAMLTLLPLNRCLRLYLLDGCACGPEAEKASVRYALLHRYEFAAANGRPRAIYAIDAHRQFCYFAHRAIK